MNLRQNPHMKRYLLAGLASFVLYIFLHFANVDTNLNYQILNSHLNVSVNGIEAASIGVSETSFSEIVWDLTPNHVLPSPFKPEIISVSANGTELCNRACGKSVNFSVPVSNLNIVLRNGFYAHFTIQTNGTSVFMSNFRPFRDRDIEIYRSNIENDSDYSSHWRSFHFSLIDNVLWFLQIFSGSLPFFSICLFVIAFIPAAVVPKNNQKISFPLISTLAIIFCSIFFYLAFVNTTYVERVPHSPDSVAYVWASKYLAAGKLFTAPLLPAFNYLGDPPGTKHSTILWPIGHPLILAIGTFFHATWVIPPIIGTLLLICILIIMLKFSRPIVAIATMLILFLSPFFQMHAVTFMSHNTAALFVAIIILFFVSLFYENENITLSVIAGISLGFLAQTRLYTAVAVTFSLLILSMFKVKTLRQNHQIKPFLLYVISSVVTTAAFLLVNKISYGSYFDTPYRLLNQTKTIFGGSPYNLLHGLDDAISYFMVLRLVILPSLPTVFMVLMCLAALNRRMRLINVFCAVSIFLIFLIDLTFDDVWGLFYGPRFWYEMVPFIFVLIGSSMDFIYQQFSWRRLNLTIITAIFLVIAYRSVAGWSMGLFPLWKNMFFTTPNNIQELKHFNFTDARLITKAESLKLNNALIFVKSCGGNWWCYGGVFHQNTINFDGNIVWAMDLGDKNIDLIKSYPGRKTYYADYNENSIVPF
jgi:hypothetical protein